MMGALVRHFDTIELAGEPEWMGAGPVHNVGVSIDRLPVRLRPASQGQIGSVNCLANELRPPAAQPDQEPLV